MLKYWTCEKNSSIETKEEKEKNIEEEIQKYPKQENENTNTINGNEQTEANGLALK